MSYLRAKVTRLGGDESLNSKYLADFNPNEPVRSLFAQVLDPNENPDDFDFQCIYCGELLDADKRLSDYDIDVYSVLQFLVKPKLQSTGSPTVTNPIAPNELNHLLTSLRWMLRSGQLIKLVSFLAQRDHLDRAVTISPAFGQDVTAYSVLQDTKMLTTLLRDRASTERFLKDHSCVVPVIQSAIQTVLGPSGDPRRAHSMVTSATSSSQEVHSVAQDYTIDQEQENDDSDEENGDDMNAPDPAGPPMVPGFGSGRTPGQSALFPVGTAGSAVMSSRVSPRVSRHQLQAAIAQAQGLLTTGGTVGAQQSASPGMGSSETSALGSPNRTTPAGVRITPNALAQALASATSTLRAPVPAPAPAPPVPMNTDPAPSTGSAAQPWASQMAQLAEMGITDELVARQALEATDGDLALAIQLLFG